MDSNIAVIIVVVINLVAMAFASGKLWQKVSDLCRRVDKLERSINGKMGEGRR